MHNPRATHLRSLPPRRRLRRASTLGATLAITLAAATTVAAPADAGDTAPGSVAVSIDANRMVSMPDSIQPGVTTFHVTSAEVSSFQLAMPAEGYTKDQAANDINKGLNQGKIKPLKRFEANMTLYGGATSTPDRGASLTVDLPAGTYWALDTNAPPAADHFLTVTVGGDDTGRTMPTPTATLKAINATDWARRPHRISHKGTLEFDNSSADNHFLELTKLKKGKTAKDFKRWVNQTMKGKNVRPPINPRVDFVTGVVGPGQSMQTNYRLPKGNYVMLCWWPDADMGGMPHVFMGMYRGIKLR